jgi:7-keto-8-aminopelargonate synthetase-like enzyme
VPTLPHAHLPLPGALLYNSGFDANVGLFACVPLSGDALLREEATHSSIHDSAHMSHVYSMNGSVAPFCAMHDVMNGPPNMACTFGH